MTTILSRQEDLGPSMLDVKYEGLLGDTGLVTTLNMAQTSLNVTSVTVELPILVIFILVRIKLSTRTTRFIKLLFKHNIGVDQLHHG